MIKFNKYKKTAVTEMIQVTKENVNEISHELLKHGVMLSLSELGDYWTVGNLERTNYTARFGDYLVREKNGYDYNYYAIRKEIQEKNYVLQQGGINDTK